MNLLSARIISSAYRSVPVTRATVVRLASMAMRTSAAFVLRPAGERTAAARPESAG